MAYDPKELVETGLSFPTQGRCFARTLRPKTYASGSGTIKPLTPVTFNSSTDKWEVWGATSAANEISRISAASTAATDGTFTITVDGETTAAIDHAAEPADVKAALEALAGIDEVTVSMNAGSSLDDDDAEMDIEFTGPLVRDEDHTVSLGTGNLTGNAHTVAENQAGDAGTTKAIHGFVWPDEVVLSSTGEVLGQTMLAGDIHYDDIVLPAGESVDNLKEALRSGPRGLGINVGGLDQVR